MKTKIVLALFSIFLLFTTYSYAQSYNNILNYHLNGTPVHGVKIKTNIPWVEPRFPYIKIEGYSYGEASVLNLSLVGYLGGTGGFGHISSSGGAIPKVWFSNENGKLVIFMEDKIYCQRFTVSAFCQTGNNLDSPSNFEGWTVVDEPLGGIYQFELGYRNTFGGVVGINTMNPRGTLDVNGTLVANKIMINGAEVVAGGGNDLENLKVSNEINANNVKANKLDVKGVIRAHEVRVETDWADFVFNKDYKLPSLDEVKAHIEEHKHLPGIPSETEVKENGIGLADISTKLLQKVEELTLYLIKQNETIEKLNNKVLKLEESKK